MKKYILLSIALLVGLLWIGNVEAGFAKNSGYSKGDTIPTLPYYSNLNRPASGAKVGSIIIKGGANSQDCGTVNNGTVVAVCVSNGTNWIPL